MQEYIVQARCMFSGYTDVFNVQADSSGDAVKKWSDNQFNIAGIITSVRYGRVTACKLEHFKPGNVKADNAPVNTAKMGSDERAYAIPYSQASKEDKKIVREIIKADNEQFKFAKANNVEVNDTYWDEDDKLQVRDANEAPPF